MLDFDHVDAHDVTNGSTLNPRRVLRATPLLERSRFLEALNESLAEVVAGAGRFVMITGEAGIGKSALVRQFCAEQRDDARVLFGACDALQTPRPLSPFIDMAASLGSSVLETVRMGGKPYVVFMAVADHLRDERPTILVIEDLHWADEATLDVVRMLARRAETLGALLVVTYRDDEVDQSPPLRMALGELGRNPDLVKFTLPALTRSATKELAGSLAISTDIDELHRRTEGNPFFLTEIVAYGGAELPATVREAVLGRVTRLGENARQALEVVAIVPPYAEMWLLEDVLGKSVAHLDACLSAGMLRCEGRRVMFRHELARVTIEESLGPHRRVTLHRRVLEALGHPPDGELDIAQLAHHADAAGDATAAQYSTTAGAHAASQGAHREAARQYARALRNAGSLSGRELAELLEWRAQECYLTNQIDDAVAAQERALDGYRKLGDRRSESAALCALSRLLWCPGRVAESESAGRDAVAVLAGIEPCAELAAAYLNLSDLAASADERAPAVAWAQAAVELAERLDATEILLQAHATIDAFDYAHGSEDGRVRLETSQELATRLGCEREVARIWHNLTWAALYVRDYVRFDRYCEIGSAYCLEHDLVLTLRYFHMHQACAALERGHWSQAAATATNILDDPGPSIVPSISALVVLGLVNLRTGEAGARELLARAYALAAPQGQLLVIAPVAVAYAEAAWLEGRDEVVLAATEDALALALERTMGREIGELCRWRQRAGDAMSYIGAQEPDAATLTRDHERAVELWTGIGCPYEAALARGDSDDAKTIQRGLAELRSLGARPAAAILAQRLRRLGARVPRGPNAAARRNPAGLTERELLILTLVATGMRNSEIAQRLVVSPRTVEHQVSAVLRKLGAKTRSEAIAIAARDTFTAPPTPGATSGP